jgi:tight adherence protein C
MSLVEISILAAIFVATAGGAAALSGYFMPNPMQARLRQASGEPDALSDPSAGAPESEWQAKVVAALSPAGKLSLPEEGWQDSPMRKRFLNAGYRGEKAAAVFFGAKTVLTLGLPALFMLGAGIAGAGLKFDYMLGAIVGLAAIGYYAPNYYLRRRIQGRQLEVFECLPDAIDLMTVMVEAGLGLDAAIARVADEMGPKSVVVGEEFKLVGLELRAGASRAQALRNLALRTGVEEVELFVAMLVQTDRFGTSMAESLRVHSEALRTKRRLRAEEAAAKIGLKLLFPLVFCIFPSIMVVLVGPAAIAIYRNFFPIATGTGG